MFQFQNAEAEVSAFLQSTFNISKEVADNIDRLCIFLIALSASFLLYYFIVWILPYCRRLASKTETQFDDFVFDEGVVKYSAKSLPAFIMLYFMPLYLDRDSYLFFIGTKVCRVILIFTIMLAIFSFFKVCKSKLDSKHRLMNGLPNLLLQVVKILLIVIGTILLISVIIDKSPAMLLTGLGASAAIMSLVFKDTLTGFVAGILLTTNDMLKKGDWICLPSHNINGRVVQVNLQTVKICNFDNSVVTIPPQSLMNNSFTNWTNENKKVRLISRAVNIDMSTIGFCTDEQLESLRSLDLLKETFEAIDKNNGLMPGSMTKPTNIGMFRAYLNAFIQNYSLTSQNPNHFHMARQLKPTPEGLPIELYFFVKETEWVAYEQVQSDVFDHVFSIMPMFGLKAYQNYHN